MKTGKSSLERKRKLVGAVVSKKTDKTVKIELEKWHFHRLYKKRFKVRQTMLIHDEKNEANVGDIIQVIESRPCSKLKKWRMLKIVEKAK